VATTPAQVILDRVLATHPNLNPAATLAFVAEILRWNPRLGLISKREPAAACERLVFESLELLDVVRRQVVGDTVRVVDVGSGGGFPGIVWAIAQPEWEFLLVERRAGKASFLEATVARLSLGNVEVAGAPIEEVATHVDYRARFDVAVAMAVSTPVELGPKLEAMLRASAWFFGTAPVGAEVARRVGKTLEWESDTHGQYGYYRAYRNRT
jgi:16S rRNA (guanine527-N7)-methyltransferase